MYLVLVILIVIVCILLGLIVLIQNPKGGGLNSNFSSSSQMMGVQKTGDFLEKGTWVLAIALMIFSLAVNVVAKNGPSSANNIQNQDQIEKASKPAAPVSGPLNLPAAPAAAPTPAKK
ncbi:preprotein translocase subunit SecG [Mucilaginibacter arboris]|uniref:Protein-export membrane protein SecG n=1 Tax=Mucilaginibacter arboris TaxID=2682090 RepID=A0A7K1SV48_9SPHI|nr:preprotein translocase subunit SecG [Mucilaginibacter arboris]MVN21195.1 preprotein translocase subunit SecG [Mucilaginibacter arboris]